MNLFKTIKRRLLAGVFLACTLSYILCGIFVTYMAEKSVRAGFDKLAQEYATGVQAQISGKIFAAAKEDVAMLAGDKRTEALVSRLGGESYAKMPGKMTEEELQHLFVFLKTHDKVLGVAIGTEEGGYLPYTYVPTAGHYDPRVRPWYTAAMAKPGRPVVSDPYMQVGNRMVLSISQTVGPIEKPLGAIVWGWSLDMLTQELNTKKIGLTGYVMLLNENDRIVVSPKHPEWLLKTPAELDILGLSGLESAHGQIRQVAWDGTDKLIYINVDPTTGWKVLCLVDAAEVAAEVQRSLLPIWLVFVVSIVIVFGLVAWVATDITRPLTKLAACARMVAEGGFPEGVPSGRDDEMGMLSRSFNHMVNELAAAAKEQEQYRQTLEEKERQFRLLAENAADIIYLYRLLPEHNLEYISPSVFAVTGYSPVEYYVDPKLLFSVVHQEDLVRLKAQLADLPVSGTVFTSFRLIRKDRSEIWVEQKCVPVVDDSGTMLAVEGIIRDVTERKKMEDEISRLDRLNVVGQMAANIAHEIRNPMTVVRGYLQYISGKNNFTKYKEQFQIMTDELDRANQIITEYLSLSKHGFVDFKTGSLNHIIEAISPLLQAEAASSGKYVKLELGTASDLYMDEKQMRQLLLNLVRNGLEASPCGGVVTISTYADNDDVILSVRDQGQGIPPNIMEKLGTPFFTTKEHGTGLGLPVCYRIADSHQGTIQVRTGPVGSEFIVRFKVSNI
ncbi:ATP-binding protein [Sporomusa sp.]|uniref:ATP-binding protein n=1 Tax=Sporomusa sp. TaxID=2078658 RepID=UPI002BA7987F|nr:ATP-binding protein [Sporomusa sp.]HWR44492.1 ATP-binding protein [Sporomusa sp.]